MNEPTDRKPKASRRRMRRLIVLRVLLVAVTLAATAGWLLESARSADSLWMSGLIEGPGMEREVETILNDVPAVTAVIPHPEKNIDIDAPREQWRVRGWTISLSRGSGYAQVMRRLRERTLEILEERGLEDDGYFWVRSAEGLQSFGFNFSTFCTNGNVRLDAIEHRRGQFQLVYCIHEFPK